MSTPVKTLPQNSGSVFLDISAGRKTANNVATIIVWATMILAMIPLVWVLWELFSRGAGAILTPEWWTLSQRGILDTEAGGGALHAIIGTFVQTILATLISVPIGIFTAIYLVEYSRGGLLSRLTTFMVDILSGVPSIVAAPVSYTHLTLPTILRV